MQTIAQLKPVCMCKRMQLPTVGLLRVKEQLLRVENLRESEHFHTFSLAPDHAVMVKCFLYGGVSVNHRELSQ
jgi:hypothetical protein